MFLSHLWRNAGCTRKTGHRAVVQQVQGEQRHPYAESLFRTCRYWPNYPSTPFGSVDEARELTLKFVQWYNYQPTVA